MRDMVRDYALETLALPGAVLVIDETGFLRQGLHSCRGGRQYTGSAGKITNCQIGVFAAYVSDKGCAFIDWQLYLPQDWTNKLERRAVAQVPDSIRFVTKPEIAAQLIERALAAACRSSGWPPTPSMAWARSRGSCAAPAKARCWARMRLISSLLGSTNPKLPAPLSRSRRLFRLRPGNAHRRATAPREGACMTGPMPSWRISGRMSTTKTSEVCGHAVC